MVLLQGRGISAGMAAGRLQFYRRPAAAVAKVRADDLRLERARLEEAQRAAARQLEDLAAQVRAAGGAEAAALFETHAMLAQDEDYTEQIRRTLEAEHCCAEYAVKAAGDAFSALFAAMDDAYMQARAADVEDVTLRILRALTGAAEAQVPLDGPVILAAGDLSPSETLRLDRSKVLAFALQGGSENSHAAILARAMGIPAVCCLGEGLREDFSGRPACLDGGTGQLILEPDGPVLAAFREKQRERREERERLADLRDLEDVTPDGRKLDICCNIGSPEEIAAVLANGGRGVGLFRSEFLYLAAGGLPSEEEQFGAYRAAAEAMGGRRVVIRTLDLGADKQAGCLRLPKEENPALGLRAVRLCLERPDIFRTQLRAIYRASAYGRVAVMFPMIVSAWELRECRRLCQAVMAELELEGVPFRRDTEIGIMIETPAAVLTAGELAREADFFSIGTNDLAQYTLACDRQAGGRLGRFFDPRHPAVLRAVKMAADAAHAAGIRVGVCGELGAEPEMLPTFLAVGVDELSVAPAAVLPVRAALRRTAARDCTLAMLEG